MTPAARAAAAIAVLDDILSGEPAEKCLSRWGRENRYAGSKDRAAVRDHVFDVLRRKRSLAAIGGSLTGRGLVLGLFRSQDIDENSIFGAGGYGPDALTDAEIASGQPPQAGAEAFDFPDWLWSVWEHDLGEQAAAAARVTQERGPVTLRVNLRRVTLKAAQQALAKDDIVTTPVGDVNSALQVVENARRVHVSRAYTEGMVEVQDLASQEAIARLDIAAGARVFDYCAGGGGKALALADRYECQVFAHDISVARTADVTPRALRAGVDIKVVATSEIAKVAPFDLVFVDAPCSGSGTWRRAPEAKWALISDKLNEYNILQGKVLTAASAFVGQKGELVYATCSVFNVENGQVVTRFLANNPAWLMVSERQRLPDASGDGFYYAVLCRQ